MPPSSAAWSTQSEAGLTAHGGPASESAALPRATVGLFSAGTRAIQLAEATWWVLLVALPAAFNPLGTLAFEPLKTSMLRCGAVLIGAFWVWGRVGARDPEVDVFAHPVVRAGLALVGLALVSTVLSIEPGL